MVLKKENDDEKKNIKIYIRVCLKKIKKKIIFFF